MDMNKFWKQVVIGVGVALLAAPGAAFAQWYFGVAVGQTNNEYLPTFDPSAGDSITDTDTAAKVFVGHDLGPNFAVELGYADLNTLVDATVAGQITRIESTSLALSLIGRAQVLPQMKMFGRLGVGRWDTTLTYNSVEDSDTGFAPVVGLGFEYRFLERFRARLEWEQYQNLGQNVAVTDRQLTGQNVDVLWFGLIYHFSLAHGG
jgi:hypothetical protein